MAKKAPQKIQHRIKITFDGDIPAVDAILCAMTGQGYLQSMIESNLSYGEVAYRMGLARKAYNLEKRQGFAALYRRGEGEIAQLIRDEIFPAFRAQVMEKLVKSRRHPTPKITESR